MEGMVGYNSMSSNYGIIREAISEYEYRWN